MSAPPPPRSSATLRILATTDLHANLLSWDYGADRSDAAVGLARTAALIRQARGEAGACLLVDNGDTLQGTPLGDGGLSGRLGGVHPSVAALNALGCDAGTIGNHDLNYGLGRLRTALADADYPVVCANLVRRRGARPIEDEPLLPPFVVLDRQVAGRPLRIGVTGLIPPQVMGWDREHLSGHVDARDMVETARDWVPAIRAAGAEIVVVLAHTGPGRVEAGPRAEQAGRALALVQGIDVLVLGHAHVVLAEVARGGPAMVSAGAYGSHLGVVDLDLAAVGDGWRVTGARAEARPIGPAEDAEVARIAAPAHRATRDRLQRVVGKTETPLSTHFVSAGDVPTARLVALAQATAVEGLMAGRDEAALPVVSAAAPFRAGGGGSGWTDIPAGSLTVRHVVDLYPFPNGLRARVVTVADLRDWIAWSARAWATVRRGASDARLMAPDAVAYNIDIVTGAEVTLDLSAPRDAPGRIRDLTVGGRRLPDDAPVLLATSSYRTGGGGGFPDRGRPAIEDGPLIQAVVEQWIAERGRFALPQGPDVRFAPLDATAVFEAGPEAATRVPPALADRVTALGPAENGGTRWRLAL